MNTHSPLTGSSHRVVVIGGGNAGLSLAGRLRRRGVRDVVVVEPRETHVYTPLQSHVAGGAARASAAVRPQADVTPPGVRWMRDAVAEVVPDENRIVLATGAELGYDHLVIACGIEMRWDAIPGLPEAMDDARGISNHSLPLAAKASPALRDVRSGTVVFVEPPEPASAGSVAQKPMYLACDWWRARGVLDDIRVVFVAPRAAAYPIPEVAAELKRALDAYGVEVHYSSRLASVDAQKAEAVIVDESGATSTIAYDLLHVAPPQAAPAWIAQSGLSDTDEDGGFVDIDPGTLRHRRYGNVWALGDAAAVDTRRSGGAIRQQSTVLARNLLAALAGREPSARYDGYSVCPITVSRHSVVFAEFDRSDRLSPTVPFWRTLYRERRLTWIFDRWILPQVYWHLILRGRA